LQRQARSCAVLRKLLFALCLLQLGYTRNVRYPISDVDYAELQRRLEAEVIPDNRRDMLVKTVELYYWLRCDQLTTLVGLLVWKSDRDFAMHELARYVIDRDHCE
jgi:hypothetical protein